MPKMATRGVTCTNILQLVQIYSLSRQTFLFIVQKSNLKWLRYCCNAKNDHQRHHLCPALKPVLVVSDPKCGTIIKICPFYKTFTANTNLRSVLSQDLWLICFVKMNHQRRHMYQQLKWVLVVLDHKCGTKIKISPFYKPFTASSNLRSDFTQELWVIYFAKICHQRCHLYQQLESL